jgi:hypothetical protein
MPQLKARSGWDAVAHRYAGAARPDDLDNAICSKELEEEVLNLP